MKQSSKEVRAAACGEHNKGASTSKKRKLKRQARLKESDRKNAQRAQLANRKSAYRRAERQTRCDPHTLTALTRENGHANEVAAD
ncbi:hypothetical protein [Stieleria neptunia]|uniref:hypothetical protein n=1 Tax=Stieleria neptunia TaxID=2527979 RepID=UPI001E37C269|nr:hypothetical protein [Stieleria neptunia]